MEVGAVDLMSFYILWLSANIIEVHYSQRKNKNTSVLNTMLLVCVCALDLVSLRHYGVVGTVYLVHTTQESSLRLS